LALIALVAVGFGTALILNLFSSEYLTQLVALLNQLLDKLRAEVPSPQVQALGQLTTAQISGWLGFWAAFSGFLAVLLARYWQASLYNPGGFRDEFHRLRLPPQLALLLLAVGLLLALLGPEYRVWIALIVLPFAIAGIALVHGIAGLKHWGRGPVVMLYLAWFFLLGLMTATLFLLALADSWLDFRGRLRAHVQ
jgi:peptidoglycan/LPS O-acetylase OafA/YrhL